MLLLLAEKGLKRREKRGETGKKINKKWKGEEMKKKEEDEISVWLCKTSEKESVCLGQESWADSC